MECKSTSVLEVKFKADAVDNCYYQNRLILAMFYLKTIVNILLL